MHVLTVASFPSARTAVQPAAGVAALHVHRPAAARAQGRGPRHRLHRGEDPHPHPHPHPRRSRLTKHSCLKDLNGFTTNATALGNLKSLTFRNASDDAAYNVLRRWMLDGAARTPPHRTCIRRVSSISLVLCSHQISRQLHEKLDQYKERVRRASEDRLMSAGRPAV